MFDLEQFIADCRTALADHASPQAVREVVARAVADPAAVLKGLGAPQRAEVHKLYHADDLTILNVIWGPQMTIMPHNHEMWAVIGIYTGREDNILWRRLPHEDGGKIEAAGAKALVERDAFPLVSPAADVEQIVSGLCELGPDVVGDTIGGDSVELGNAPAIALARGSYAVSVVSH